ncbi:MAG: hypothetical protein H6985_04775 [Pseudomonadales bacterium]|nr:hypothetical protein [Halioglobus sp.]MCP5128883.1 hypothetical protein [Pseudomonadales bacterium]
MKKIGVVLASALLLGGCVTGSDAITPVKQTDVFGQEKDSVSVTTAAAFQGKKEVVIGSFKVGFIQYNRASETSGGGAFSSNAAAKTTVKSNLVGVPESTMQEITDAAYKDFVSELEANGYIVLDRSVLTNLDAYKKATSAASPSKLDDITLAPKSDVVYFAPSGQELFFMVGEKSSGFGALSSGIGFANPGIAFQAAADADKITIVNANFLVNFVNTEGYGGSHRSTSSVSLDPGLSIVPGSTVTIIGGYDGTFSKNIGSISLGQPVYSVEEFGSIEETTSTAESAAGIFSMVVGGLADISSTNSGTFAVTADPNAYQTVTSGLLKDANTQLVTAMAANR